MKQINSYIFEKLKINNDAGKPVKSPFDDWKYEDAVEFLDLLVQKIENSGAGEPMIWNDTKKWEASDDFEYFDTTDGRSIDWLEEFERKVDHKMVAIWKFEEDKPIKNEIIDFLKSQHKEESLYRKGRYYVKYWGSYDIKDTNWDIDLLEATTSEDGNPIICFALEDYETVNNW